MACVDDSDFSMLQDDEESDFETEDNVFDMTDDEDEEEIVAPPKKTKGSKPAPKKKAAPKKKVALAPVSPNVVAAKTSKKKKDNKTVEETYQKKTQLEHILLRPDTYIGSTEPVTQPMFVLKESAGSIVKREITFTPGLYKIFDEILVNAADNKQRDSNMNRLDITIDPEENTISVKNNGQGIPVVMHKEHKCYVPTLIFGHLLTGSNFDDDTKKTTGGRNGYGAKLANIFSLEFVVECCDSERGVMFRQVFKNNMSEKGEPVITECTPTQLKAGDFTKITFSPDLHRFKMTSLNANTVALLSKRAYDIAGSMANRPGKKLAVTLNGEVLAIKSFSDYIKKYENINTPVAFEKIGERWEIGVAATDGTSAEQISFVNAICTSKGGGHVNYISDQLSAHLVKILKKKNKGGKEIKPAQIKNHLCVFVNCLVDNPAFDSQTKECLTTRPKGFGSVCKPTDVFLKKVEKSEIIDVILSFARFKEKQDLKKSGGTKKKKLTGIAKLDDANHAGSAKSKDCTLILTEGDSAKSLAMSGLSVVGRDFYGVFPLRGKLLNVRDATISQMIKNEEVKHVIEIMGLKHHVEYTEDNIKTLRYGHIMIMADQDHDGSHIKGLVINMIEKYWPSLLDVPGFLQQFITPIVKVTKGRSSRSFFTVPEYENWRESTGNGAKGWKIKYYKGLGTSTSAEAKDYFSNLDLHEINFAPISAKPDVVVSNDWDLVTPDTAKSSEKGTGKDLIDMAFRKNRVEDRKAWLSNMDKNTFLDYSLAHEEGVTFSDFVNKELILFSKADNDRSIAHVMDGFKPSQRKVLFACFKRKLKDEIKVAQLAGYIGEHSAYHHGENSLHGTIINMAQTYVGSNNINLLTPAGQFGTRRLGGKDNASPRYIFTKLEKITRTIFHPDDDELLNFLEDDGLSIEPEFYMPVIPMVLVNGSDGIGTGWSSTIANYDPRAIVRNIKRLIAGEELETMHPFYNGFTGELALEKPTRYTVTGKIERIDDTSVLISELPIKKWTQDYKGFLELLHTGDKAKKMEPGDIKDFKENHTDTTVSFTVIADKAKIDKWESLPKGGLYAKFKLTTSLATSNMHLFDTQGHIVKYQTAEDVMNAFYPLRLEFYDRRKELLLKKLRNEQRMLSNKARFVEEVCSGELIVSNRKKAELLEELHEKGYELFDKNDKNDTEEEEEEEDRSLGELAKGYDYLLGLKIWSLTFEKAEALREQLAERTAELEELEATTPSQIWLNDLDEIEEAMNIRDMEMNEAEEDEKKAKKKTAKRQASKKKKAALTKKKGKKKADEWDSAMEESDVEEDDYGDDDSSDVEIVKKKATTVRRAPAKGPATKTAPAKKAPAPTNVVTDEVEMTLMERLKNNLMVSPPQKKPVASLKVAAISKMPSFGDNDDDDSATRGKKRASPKSSDCEEDDDFEFDAPAPKARRIKKAAPTKKAAPKKSAPKKAVPKKAAPKKVETTDDSEDDFEDELPFEESDDDVEVLESRAPSSRRPARNAVKTTYAIDSDDDSDFEF